MNNISRRNMMKLLGYSAFAANVPTFSFQALASTNQSYSGKFFIFCSFDGGWDQLMCTDPRDQTQNQFKPGSAIDPYYDQMSGISDVLDLTNSSGVYRPAGASNIAVGPAMYELARDHWKDMCIVRGVDMGTLTHAVGRRYALTGKFPRGLQASGASLVTAATAGMGQFTPIPNLVIGMESFNEGQPSWASGFSISQPDDILSVLRPLSPNLDDSTRQAISTYLNKRSKHADFINSTGLVDQFERAIPQATDIASGLYASYFDRSDSSTNNIAKTHFGITSDSQMVEASGQAFMAAQAITKGLAQSVSIQLALGLDHHDEDLLTDHAPALRKGFVALGQLISYLKNTLDINGKPYWNRTVIMATSEFGRGPVINSQYGRDHHLTNSVLLAGAGIKGDNIIGATDNINFQRELINPATGRVVLAGTGGKLIRPSDVHATLLEAMGLSWKHLENQLPTLLESAYS